MSTEPDDIALLVLNEFRKLPAKRKPAVRDNGLREWVPLSGIVVKGRNFMECVALATGMKCLPATKLPQANGIALHDWHAEVLAIRAFNRFILDECRRLAQDSAAESEFLRRRSEAELPFDSDGPWHHQLFAWRDDLTLHMYCSEAPCGDASMELIMSAQADATPWEISPSISPSPCPIPSPAPAKPPQSDHTTAPRGTDQELPPTNETSTQTEAPPPPPSSQVLPQLQPPFQTAHGTETLHGRSYFSHLGIVRRKPARSDAPPTASKSCSDKLALKQCTSLLSSLISLFVSPQHVYLTSIILPESQFSAVACRRCFSAGTDSSNINTDANDGGTGEGMGRMRPVGGRVWEGTGYAFRGVKVEVTGREFEFSRRGILEAVGGQGEGVKLAASNLAVAWTAGGEVEEGLIGGVLQGRKAFDIKGASSTSRRRMWAAAVEVAALLEDEGIFGALAKGTYEEVKEGALLDGRRRVKEEVRGTALKGWLRNTGDRDFSL